MNKLPTVRQIDAMTAINELTAIKGYPPTLAEIALFMNLRNRMTAKEHLDALRTKGLVTWEAGRNRTIKLVQDSPKKGRWVNVDQRKWRWVD